MTTKQSPADFVVEEILAADFARQPRDRPAAFALYRLTKENLTTPDAAAAAARALGVRPGEVAYAGLKDRHARTTQHITVPFRPTRLQNRDEQAEARGPGWWIVRLGWVDFPITAGAIAANRFRIVVRDLTREACGRMDEAVRLLAPAPRESGRDPSASAGQALTIAARTTSSLRPSVPTSLFFVNYFGDQRFGSARHGRGLLAGHLIRGEFEDALWLAIATWARKDNRRRKEFKRTVADKWKQWPDLVAELPRCPERRAIEHLAGAPDDYRGSFAALPYGFQELAVHAYQSYLWNATARRLATERCPGPVMTVHDPFGEMVFPAAAGVPPDLAALEMPILGRDSPLVEPWRAAAEAVLAEQGITTAMLRIPGLRRPHFGAASRRLFAAASDLSMSPPERDTGTEGAPPPPAGGPPAGHARAKRPLRFARTVSFDLPRGAYATVLLRALGQ